MRTTLQFHSGKPKNTRSSVDYAVWINKPVVASVELDFKHLAPKTIALDATVLV
jgi:hypothetical protein